MIKSKARCSILRLVFALLYFSTAAFARNVNYNVLPSANIFPNQEGILFPGFSIAAGIDAAAIPSSGKGTDVAAAYGPPLQAGASQTGFLSAVNAFQNFGFGVGYDGLQASSGTFQHGVFAGTGIGLRDFSLGIGMRSADVTSGFNPQVDLSIAHITNRGLALAAVVYDVADSKQIDVGIGYSRNRNYNVEVNVLLPPASQLGQSGADYKLLAGVGANPGIFSFHLTSIYDLLSSSFTSELSGGIWVSERGNLFLQVTSPRTVKVGLNWTF